MGIIIRRFKGELLILIVFLSPFFFFAGCSDNYNALKAKALMEERCVQCHKLFTPDVKTDEQWEQIVPRMNQRMVEKNMPILNMKETNDIIRFLQENN